MYIVFTCNTPSFCESRGSPAHCFHRNSTRMRKKLTSTCQFSAITLLTSHSCGLLLLSCLSLTLQSSERAHFIAFVRVYKCVCACSCAPLRVCVCVCTCLPACMCLCVYACAYMCQKLDMILSPVKALDHSALLTPDLTVQLN